MGFLATNKVHEVTTEAFRGGSFLLLGNASSTIILALGAILIARLLGPEAYGTYSLSLIPSSLFLIFTDFGIDAAVTKFTANGRPEDRKRRARRLIRLALLFKAITAAAMVLLCLSLSEKLATNLLNRPEIEPLIRLSVLLIPAQALANTASYAFLASDKAEYSALVMNIQALVKTLSASILVLLGLGVLGAVSGVVLGYAAAGTAAMLALYHLHFRNKDRHKEESTDDLRFRRMMVYGFPLFISAVLATVLTQYQGIVLSHLATDTDIGNLQVSTQFMALTSVIASAMPALFPAFAKLQQEDINRLFRTATKYSAILVVPTATAIAVLSKDLIYTIYGSSYSIAPILLSMQVVTFLYAGIGSLVVGQLLSGVGETRLILKANLLNLVVYLPLAPLLVTRLGVIGAVLAGVTTSLLSTAYQLFSIHRKLQVSINLPDSARTYLASAVSVLPTIVFLRLSTLNSFMNVVFGGSMFLATYLTTMPLLGVLHAGDIDLLSSIIARFRAGPLLKPILLYLAKLAEISPTRKKQSQIHVPQLHVKQEPQRLRMANPDNQ